MKNKLLSNLSYILCAGLGLLTFIFFAVPYVTSFLTLYTTGWKQENTVDIVNGYQALTKFWGEGFFFVISAILQILVLLLGVAMLAFGVWALLKVFNVVKIFPEKVWKLESKRLSAYALYAYAALQGLLFLFLSLSCATRTGTERNDLYTLTSGFRLNAGIFIAIVFALATVGALHLQPKLFPAEDNDRMEKVYLCSACGKKGKRGMTFCPDCGGKIEEQFRPVVQYICSACGKKAKKGMRFCPHCGGKVEEKTTEIAE